MTINYLLLLATMLYFLLGTAVGSFLDVWARRILRGESPTGRSKCEDCGHVLSASDLIPLLSFLFLRGRCRYCRKPLSWQYPIVEVGTGIVFASLAFKFGVLGINFKLLAFIPLLVAVSALIAAFITDILEQVIADKFLVVGAGAAFLYRATFYLTNFDSNGFNLGLDILGALGVFALFQLIRWATKKRGMGDGDPPLGFAAGLLVGFPLVLVQIFLTFTLGGLVAAVLLVLKKKHLKDKVAFGPFLIIAAFATLLFGEYILDWYLTLLSF
ncbi:MAG TPA: prepilin peptidase [candidate division WWE3 bacterium]|uniref:Prepilin peptidase n=1 Tax=candidate division WWE3 bacterium TaxID=2053526 RepID=A0A7C1NN79_UNCKA|nr:prepilin peptidase [candidate division WWE3 bacterium]